jgi:hypothetical protein
MKNIKNVVLAGVLGSMALVSVQASAADDFFAPKRNELSLYGSIDNQSQSTTGSSSTSTNLQTVFGQFGHYFTPQIVGNVGLALMKSGGAGVTTTFTDVAAGVKYYFKVGKQGDWTPFVLADLGVSNFSGGGVSGSGYMVDGAGGVTYWVTESAGINVDGKYKRESVSVTGTTLTTTHTMVEFGLTLKF